MTKPDVQWDYQGLLAHFQGPSGVRREMRAAGIKPPTYQAILMWKRRNSIPGRWLAVLLQLLAEQNTPVDQFYLETVP